MLVLTPLPQDAQKAQHFSLILQPPPSHPRHLQSTTNMAAIRLLSFAALVLLAATGSKALDIPTEITLCDGSYTYVRPTPAERNSSTGFEYHLSYSSDFAGESCNCAAHVRCKPRTDKISICICQLPTS